MLEGALEESDPGCGTEELQQVLQKYPNLQNLSGSLYYTLESSLGAEDPYSLVEPRHLPTVKMFDLKVSSVIRPLGFSIYHCSLVHDSGSERQSGVFAGRQVSVRHHHQVRPQHSTDSTHLI